MREQLDLHDVAGLRVERGERLVHQQHVRIGGERPCQADTLLHAAGEFVRVVAFEAGEPDHVDQAAADLAALVGGHALELEAELDVVLHGAPRQQPELLEHHGAVGAWPGNGFAGKPKVAGIDAKKTEKSVEKRALPTAGRANYREKLAFFDVDVEIVQRAHRPRLGGRRVRLTFRP